MQTQELLALELALAQVELAARLASQALLPEKLVLLAGLDLGQPGQRLLRDYLDHPLF